MLSIALKRRTPNASESPVTSKLYKVVSARPDPPLPPLEEPALEELEELELAELDALEELEPPDDTW